MTFLLILFVIWIGQLMLYIFQIPSFADSPIEPRSYERTLGIILFYGALSLSLLRLPFAILPTVTKIVLSLVLLGLPKKRLHYGRIQFEYIFEVMHLIGDLVNLILIWRILDLALASFPNRWELRLFFHFVVCAELIRLILEPGQMLFSAAWLILPHRSIATTIKSFSLMPGPLRKLIAIFHRYCYYYLLDNTQRAEYILLVLKKRAMLDPEMLVVLAYVQKLRIVPDHHKLRNGVVRDIVQSEVFLHAKWTNDPWMLMGLVIRRSPWIFDPRYLQRPFYYRSGSQRFVTKFQLQHIRYTLPFGLYTIGHEIRVGRFDVFYRICRFMGFDIETKVREDGTFQFTQMASWLYSRLGRTSSPADARPLWNEDEVVADMFNLALNGTTFSAYRIARRYTYPPKYVEEVLIEKIARSQKFKGHD